MNYLKPIDKLKMDRSFIRGIETEGKDRTMVSAIISVAQSMKLRVTAEGVEKYKQLAVLESQRCDEIQGYYISRPMAAEKAEAYLRTFVKACIAAA